MVRDFEEYKKRHLSFWELQEIDRPLIGFTLGMGLDSWSYWQYNQATRALLNQGKISPQDIHPEAFVEDQLNYLELFQNIPQDVCTSAMPLASIPWMEAVLGCPVVSTEAGFKSIEILENVEKFEAHPFNPQNSWVEKYLEFIEFHISFRRDKSCRSR